MDKELTSIYILLGLAMSWRGECSSCGREAVAHGNGMYAARDLLESGWSAVDNGLGKKATLYCPDCSLI